MSETGVPSLEPVGTTQGWEHFEHEADMGIRGFGPTVEAAFAEVAVALTAVVVDPQSLRTDTRKTVEVQAADPELLLLEWIDALIFEMAVNHMLFSRFALTIDDGRLTATAWGEGLDPERHAPAVEVKGATFTALRVSQEPGGGWVAQCVVDV